MATPAQAESERVRRLPYFQRHTSAAYFFLSLFGRRRTKTAIKLADLATSYWDRAERFL